MRQRAFARRPQPPIRLDLSKLRAHLQPSFSPDWICTHTRDVARMLRGVAAVIDPKRFVPAFL